MANEENLIPMNRRTENEAREIARKGGIKSGEARRRKRDMREAAKMLLNMDVSNKQKTLKATMTALGISENEMDYSMGVMATMLIQAANGNVKAAQFLRDTAGYNPRQQLEEQKLRYQKSQDKLSREREEAGISGSLADAIMEAYEQRAASEMEGEDDAEK